MRTWLQGENPVGTRRILIRAVVLVVLLCGIKLVLLGSLESHLYHTHWRVATPAPTWLDHCNFFLFASLVPLTLGLIGRSIPPAQTRTIRGLNAGLIVVGLLFACLTFKRMGSNYLYPVMSGLLNMSDVWHYLQMDLCFEQPFLAAYLLGYVLVYWILVRTRKEHVSFWVLGGVAALYLVMSLHELAVWGQEIFVINCCGLAGLASLWIRRGELPWKWQVLPLALPAAAWFFFAPLEQSLLPPNPYLVLILSVSLALLGLANICLRRTAAYRVLSHFLPFYFLAFFILAGRHYPLAGNYTHLFVWSLASVHYFWQELLLTGLAFVVFIRLQRVLPRAAVRLFDAGVLLLVLVGLVDLNLTRNMGFRLDWSALVVCNDVVLLWHTIRPFMGQLILAVVAFIACYVGLLLFGDRLLRRREKTAPTKAMVPVFPVTWGLLLMAAAPALVDSDKAEGLGLTQVIATSPLVAGWGAEKMNAEEFNQTVRSLGLAEFHRTPPAVSPGPGRDLNVLLVVLESSCNRYLSMFGAADETQPRLKKYRDRMELFPNFYCNFVNSLNARCTVVSGLYPCRPYVTYVNPRLEAPSLFELFHDRGYAVSLFDSCYRDYQRWNDYLVRRKIDFFYDAGNMPGKEKFKQVSWGLLETATMEAIKGQFARHAEKGERFFLTYMPVAPHMPFDSPAKEFEKFDNGVGQLNNDYTGRYKNQLLYMDWVITGLLDELARLKLLEKTLVVITDDHGEMVGEDDKKVGHGWNLEPWLANVPLIIMDPQRQVGSTNLTLGSHIDILPTIFDILHLPLPSGELYEGVSLHQEAANQGKVIYISSHLPRAMIKGSRYILEEPGRKSSGQGSAVHVYEISHQGVKTSFRRLEEKPQAVGELEQFERFQKSLIENYSSYRKMFQGRGAHPDPAPVGR